MQETKFEQSLAKGVLLGPTAQFLLHALTLITLIVSGYIHLSKFAGSIWAENFDDPLARPLILLMSLSISILTIGTLLDLRNQSCGALVALVATVPGLVYHGLMLFFSLLIVGPLCLFTPWTVSLAFLVLATMHASIVLLLRPWLYATGSGTTT